MSLIPFIGGAAPGKSPKVSVQSCVNMYAEASSTGQSGALYSTPGSPLFVNCGKTGEVRCLHMMGNRIYAVVHDHVYRITPNGAYEDLGHIGTSQGPVFAANNGKQVLFVDGVNGWVASPAQRNPLQPVNDPDFLPRPGSVASQDGYFIVNSLESGQFAISELYDGLSWDALDFASAEGNPDGINRVLSDHRELWLFGPFSLEVYYDSGAQDFPFVRISGAYSETGTCAPASPASADNTVFWLSSKRQVVRAQGYVPVVISTREIEYQISTYARVDDAIGFTYIWEGHELYQLTFPTGNATWVYDISTNLWHQRTSYPYSVSYPIGGRHRANCHCTLDGRHFVGDFETGDIYELDSAEYQDNGQYIVREVATAHIRNEGKRVFYYRLQMEMETGPEMPLTVEPLEGSTNLVSGPGFESYSWSTHLFSGWSDNHSYGWIEPATSNPDPHGGTQSCQIHNGLYAGTMRVYSATPIPVLEGRTYTLSVWSCTDDATVGKYEVRSATIAGTVLATDSFPASAQWTETTKQVVIPAGVTAVVIALYNAGTPDADTFLDDVSWTLNPVVGVYAGEPQVMLQWSDDGGRTWSNEHWRGLGPVGDYGRRVIWRRLGSARERAFRARFSGQCRWVIVAGYLDMDSGVH